MHRWVIVVGVAWLFLLNGCLERELKPLNPCLVSGVVSEVQVERVDKVDLLFVVDNSGSMKQEQEALARELPRLIQVLTTGDRDGDGIPEFPPAGDLHLGVVSTDLGVTGIVGVEGCDAVGGGDDGLLQHGEPEDRAECAGPYPPFIDYRADADDPQATADAFSCIATLGTKGCGYEQPLEAALKALWPAQDHDPVTGEALAENRIRFYGDSNGFGTTGHGDQANAGFLRNDPRDPSVLAVIFVTDEEDCSSDDMRHFTPRDQLDPSDPLFAQNINLRCHFTEDLYPIRRYVDGLRALRPGLEHLLVFGAIVGVPPELVDARAREGVDFSDQRARDAYYDGLLAHPRMQETIDPSASADNGSLVPSCITETGHAMPPRRIVETAKALGEGAVVQSICQDDFRPAIDAIIESIQRRLPGLCLPKQLVRDAAGEVGCDVLWELPMAGSAPVGTPTSCASMPFLSPLDPPRIGADGGEVCRIAQVPVVDQRPSPTALSPEGWFYDNFSESVAQTCPPGLRQQVSFTDAAAPPKHVVVKLECLDERPTLGESGDDLQRERGAPTIGSPCDVRVGANGAELVGDAACEVRLLAPTADFPDGIDRGLFCHPEQNVCVRPCGSHADCPPAWVCDERAETVAGVASEARPEGSGICINPTCGSSD